MIVSASTLTPRKPAQPQTNEAAGDSQTFQTAVQAAQSNATNQGSSGSIQRVRQDIAAWNYQQSHSAHNKSFNLKGIQSDLVSTLRNAANAHQINDVLSQLNSSELATVGRILDQHGSTGSAAGARGSPREIATRCLLRWRRMAQAAPTLASWPNRSAMGLTSPAF